MKLFRRLLPLVVLHWTFGLAATAAEPPTTPLLRIEAGMHTATIWRASADASGRLALTISDDKTARLWELPSGRFLRVLRPPVGAGNEGKLSCAALSPDGTLAAVSGWTGGEWDKTFCVYLFDTATGRLVRRLTELSHTAIDLAFSQGGQWLAASLGANAGIRVWQVSSGLQMGKDTNYSDRCNGLNWHGDDRLVTTCYDGRVRLYQWQEGQPLSPVLSSALKQGKQPLGAHFSPDGRRIAVGFRDLPAVAVLDASDLKLLFAPNVSGVSIGNLGRVAWSADGATLAAGGTWHRDGKFQMRLWSLTGKKKPRDLSVGSGTVMSLCPLPNGDLLFGTAAPAWGVVRTKGQVSMLAASPIADFRSLPANFRLADGARQVSLQYLPRKDLALFDLTERQLRLGRPGEMLPPNLRAPRTDGLDITGWEGATTPKLDGKPLPLDAHERAHSLAIAPDASFFLMGADWYFRCFAADGAVRWKLPAPGATWAVNITEDGLVAVAAYADGSIRWYRSDTGKELLAFFPHADKQRWVLWTPEGYYDCSPGAESLIGWHVNRGKDQAADFFPAAKFRDQFYRPDVIQQVLKTQDLAAALKAANEASGRKAQGFAQIESLMAKMQPPVIELAVGGVQGEATVNGVSFTVRYKVRSGGTESITRVRALVDGRPLPKELPIPKDGDEVAEAEIVVPERDCVISLLAEHRFAVSEPATLRLTRSAATVVAAEPGLLKPKLYLLAVGVSKYAKNDRFQNLQYAAKDAQDFAAAFKRQEGGLYDKVDAKLLADDKATAGDVLDGLDWIKKETTAKDVAIIFLSGHGENDEELRYFFCPHDYDHTRRLRTGVAMEDIQKTLAGVAGKVLFFIDSCHAGNALGKLFAAKGSGTQLDLTRLVNELSSAENGAVVFASSTGRQVSVESEEWQNGAFTKAIVEGLDGKADFRGSGKITISGLEYWIAERVKELSAGTQTPTVAKPQTVPDFLIGIKR